MSEQKSAIDAAIERARAVVKTWPYDIYGYTRESRTLLSCMAQALEILAADAAKHTKTEPEKNAFGHLDVWCNTCCVVWPCASAEALNAAKQALAKCRQASTGQVQY